MDRAAHHVRVQRSRHALGAMPLGTLLNAKSLARRSPPGAAMVTISWGSV
jgi:hypothetical protein